MLGGIVEALCEKPSADVSKLRDMSLKERLVVVYVAECACSNALEPDVQVNAALSAARPWDRRRSSRRQRNAGITDAPALVRDYGTVAEAGIPPGMLPITATHDAQWFRGRQLTEQTGHKSRALSRTRTRTHKTDGRRIYRSAKNHRV
jgi:hypothetical protein